MWETSEIVQLERNWTKPPYRGFLFALIDIVFTIGDTKVIWLVS